MKRKIPWYMLGFIFLGLGFGLVFSIVAAYVKAYIFGGMEEETFAVYVVSSLILFGSIGILVGRFVEKKWDDFICRVSKSFRHLWRRKGTFFYKCRNLILLLSLNRIEKKLFLNVS